MSIDINTIIMLAGFAGTITGFVVFGQKQKEKTLEVGEQKGMAKEKLKNIKDSLDSSHDKHRETEKELRNFDSRLIEIEAQLQMICDTLNKLVGKMDEYAKGN